MKHLIALGFFMTTMLPNTLYTHTYSGTLCVIEGIDGAGKTTLIQNLEQLSAHDSYHTHFTKEPGATDLGKQIRTIVLQRTKPINLLAEFLLFAADRAQHFHEVIIPKLQQGDLIISDRMSYSSLVYQGFVKGLDHTIITTVNNWCMQNIQPDIIIYLRIDAAHALTRLKHTRGVADNFEQEILDRLQTVIDGFDTIFKDNAKVITFDGLQDPLILAEQVHAVIKQHHTQKP